MPAYQKLKEQFSQFSRLRYIQNILMLAAQLFQKCLQTNPNLFEQIKMGNFASLKNWLSENVYSYASSLSTEDFLKKVTGETLNPNYFLSYIKKKYL